jgi:hypothetical protein
MQLVRDRIVPHTKEVLAMLHPAFTPDVVAEIKEIRRRHATVPFDEMLRPFDGVR